MRVRFVAVALVLCGACLLVTGQSPAACRTAARRDHRFRCFARASRGRTRNIARASVSSHPSPAPHSDRRSRAPWSSRRAGPRPQSVHSRASGNADFCEESWVPACAGTNGRNVMGGKLPWQEGYGAAVSVNQLFDRSLIKRFQLVAIQYGCRRAVRDTHPIS
jgi:hypothetical protein